MKAFLKENIVLVAGISLPVILALVFLVATSIQQSSVEPPKHKVIFATNYYKTTSHNHYPYRFVVKDDRLTFSYTPQEKGNWISREPQLYVFDPLTETSTEIVIPDIENYDEEFSIEISDIPEGRLLTTKGSLDGFTFEHDYRGGGNLMTEIFGGGYRYRSEYVLRKDGYRLKVPHASRYNTEFIAWIQSHE